MYVYISTYLIFVFILLIFIHPLPRGIFSPESLVADTHMQVNTNSEYKCDCPR